MKTAKSFSLILFMLLLSTTAVQSQTELSDPYPGSQTSWSKQKDLTVAWGSIDQRYPRSQAAVASTKLLSLEAWIGETVNAQAIVVAPKAIDKVFATVTDLKSGRHTIPASNIRVYKVGYVMGDNFQKTDSLLVADRLVAEQGFGIDGQTTRPLWITINVPQDAKPGKYAATLNVDCDGSRFKLPLRLTVSSHRLPPPAEWSFHLDLWQNPYAVARYFNVPLWSREHFDRMRPIMQTLAAAGQKVITCSIIQHPWNSQTYDPFESMIGKMKTVDGQWKYDYTVFDRWVEFMMSLGIDKQIDCYTLVPWHYRFDYYDMSSNTVRYVNCQPGEKAYEDFLLPFLKDFAAHLKAKGWFERTCIAMDERPTDQLRAAYALVKRADPGFRMEGAYNYFPEFIDEVYDISVGYQYPLLEKASLTRRKAQSQPVTFYTCCGPERPNTFVFSPPAESAYMGWHAAAVGYDGYLRWAYNSWVESPVVDARFRTWPAGDCFLVYPDGPSIRMQRLVEGIQAFEKVRILRQEGVQGLDAILQPFQGIVLNADVDVAEMVKTATRQINSLGK